MSIRAQRRLGWGAKHHGSEKQKDNAGTQNAAREGTGLLSPEGQFLPGS